MHLGHAGEGITPARAGRRARRVRGRARSGNHSRAGGTELTVAGWVAQVEESLPRGRDGGEVPGRGGGGCGITPARAGRRIRPLRWWSIEWNHSRAGGTEGEPVLPRGMVRESLPRGRDGAVPNPSTSRHGVNHSRAGGTEPRPTRTPKRSRESLPRGRDGDRRDDPHPQGCGITPARAGRSNATRRCLCAIRNHSRAGGTECGAGWDDAPAEESLPRGRDGGCLTCYVARGVTMEPPLLTFSCCRPKLVRAWRQGECRQSRPTRDVDGRRLVPR